MTLWLALSIIVLGSILIREWRLTWTAALLLANWGLNTWVAQVSHTQFNWAAMALVDYVAAALILCIPLTRWQIIVACLYAYELIAHAARAWVGASPWSDYYYWYALHYGAWAQLWVVAIWLGYDGAGRLWRRLGADRRARFAAALPRLMGSGKGGRG
jgi:hypothetical protein